MSGQPRHPRRTQDERRATTRAALLDATVTALAEHGYAGATTRVITDLAGVSGGARVHHFATKAELVAAAVRHMAHRRADTLVHEATALPPAPEERVPAALDLLWRSHSGPLFFAVMELWIAARTDPELRARLASVEAEVAVGVRAFCSALFARDPADPEFVRALDLTLAAIRGTALLANLAGSDMSGPERAWQASRGQLQTLFTTT